MAEIVESEHHRGEMDIADQKATFAGFLTVSAWGSALTIMLVALLVVAFAMGAGWFAGVAVWAVIGVAAGVFLSMRAAWWATLVGTTLLMAIGGGIAALVAPLLG